MFNSRKIWFTTILLFLVRLCLPDICNAQISEGSIAPDFTFTDINGNVQNLYSYLNEGKYVAIDFSAVWCSPCWGYNSKGVFDSLYNKYDSGGTNTWKIIFLEGDPTTGDSSLYGSGNGTKGNWVTGHKYTIINPPLGTPLVDFWHNYNLGFYPTLMLICPDKKVYSDTLRDAGWPTVKTWEYLAENACAEAPPSKEFELQVSPNPSHNDININFSLAEASEIKLNIYDIMGQLIVAKKYSAIAGLNKIQLNNCRMQSGIYTILITGKGLTGIQKFVVE